MTLRLDLVDFRAKLRAFLREHTLDALWLIRRGNNTQRGMSRELKVDVTRICRILVYLEAGGYVVSEPVRSTLSGRPQKNYYLTEKGEALLKVIHAVNEITSPK